MPLRRFFSCFTRQLHSSLSWKPTGKLQQTLASEIAVSGTGLHSGNSTTARLLPAKAGEGRFFVSGGTRIPATIDHALDSPLCTTLCRDGARVRTVEHLLSALEACGVNNCSISIQGGDEVPILDGSAKEWVKVIEEVGLCVARDSSGKNVEGMVPVLHETKHLLRDDSFIVAFPSLTARITYGINFSQVPDIGCQWFSRSIDIGIYSKEIASSRTFCIYEEVEKMQKAGLIKGGSTENAMICSVTEGWLNPPLRFHDEPCRHKVLDLIGDFSLFAQSGNQGLPLAHIIAYKAGHSLHAEFVRLLSR